MIGAGSSSQEKQNTIEIKRIIFFIPTIYQDSREIQKGSGG